MTIETHVSTFKEPEECTYHPEDGIFAHGLMMEGARWSVPDEITEKFAVGEEPPTECAGCIMDSNPKELLWSMPVMYIKAVVVKDLWEPTSVGYLRHDPKTYECPVYITRFRGPTYVFLSTLNTETGTEMWVLRGVALVFQDDN